MRSPIRKTATTAPHQSVHQMIFQELPDHPGNSHFIPLQKRLPQYTECGRNAQVPSIRYADGVEPYGFIGNLYSHSGLHMPNTRIDITSGRLFCGLSAQKIEFSNDLCTNDLRPSNSLYSAICNGCGAGKNTAKAAFDIY